MNRHLHAWSTIAFAALAVALLGAASPPRLAVPQDAAVVYNPGNDDYAGFSIVVEPNGRAEAVDAAGRAQALLDSDVTQRFFDDLAAAAPLALNAGVPCAASSNLSTSAMDLNAALTVSWRATRLSRLSCATDSRSLRVLSDATEIQRALYVQCYRERTIVVWVGNRGNDVTYQPMGTYGNPNFGFSTGQFSIDKMIAGQLNLPKAGSGYPNGGLSPSSMTTTNVAGSLPTSSTRGSYPPGTLPVSNPYTGLSGSLPLTDPWGQGPYTSP